jgi:hypothetical protein
MKIFISVSAAPVAYKKGDRVIVKVDRGQYMLATITAVRVGKWHLLFDDGDKGASDDIDDLYGLAGPAKHPGVIKRGDLPTYRLQPVQAPVIKKDVTPKDRKHNPDDHVKPVPTPAPAATTKKEETKRTRKGGHYKEGDYAKLAETIMNPTGAPAALNARERKIYQQGVDDATAGRKSPSSTLIESPKEFDVWQQGFDTVKKTPNTPKVTIVQQTELPSGRGVADSKKSPVTRKATTRVETSPVLDSQIMQQFGELKFKIIPKNSETTVWVQITEDGKPLPLAANSSGAQKALMDFLFSKVAQSQSLIAYSRETNSIARVANYLEIREDRGGFGIDFHRLSFSAKENAPISVRIVGALKGAVEELSSFKKNRESNVKQTAVPKVTIVPKPTAGMLLTNDMLDKGAEHLDKLPPGLTEANYATSYHGRIYKGDMILGAVLQPKGYHFLISPRGKKMVRWYKQIGRTVDDGYNRSEAFIENLMDAPQMPWDTFVRARQGAKDSKDEHSYIVEKNTAKSQEAADKFNLQDAMLQPTVAVVQFKGNVTETHMIKGVKDDKFAIWGGGTKLRWLPASMIKTLGPASPNEIARDEQRSKSIRDTVAGRPKNVRGAYF